MRARRSPCRCCLDCATETRDVFFCSLYLMREVRQGSQKKNGTNEERECIHCSVERPVGSVVSTGDTKPSIRHKNPYPYQQTALHLSHVPYPYQQADCNRYKDDRRHAPETAHRRPREYPAARAAVGHPPAMHATVVAIHKVAVGEVAAVA